jgi:hypothetical protein
LRDEASNEGNRRYDSEKLPPVTLIGEPLLDLVGPVSRFQIKGHANDVNMARVNNPRSIVCLGAVVATEFVDNLCRGEGAEIGANDYEMFREEGFEDFFDGIANSPTVQVQRGLGLGSNGIGDWGPTKQVVDIRSVLLVERNRLGEAFNMFGETGLGVSCREREKLGCSTVDDGGDDGDERRRLPIGVVWLIRGRGEGETPITPLDTSGVVANIDGARDAAGDSITLIHLDVIETSELGRIEDDDPGAKTGVVVSLGFGNCSVETDGGTVGEVLEL